MEDERLAKEDVAYWRKKEEQLRKKEEQLRDKELSLALKVMVKDGTNEALKRLECEKVRMDEAKSKCPDQVMGVEEDGFQDFEDGVVMLMSNVGRHYSKLAPQYIFDSLINPTREWHLAWRPAPRKCCLRGWKTCLD